MSERAPRRSFALIGAIGRLSGRAQRDRQFGSIARPRPALGMAPRAVSQELADRLTPIIGRLDADRAALLARSETELRISVAGAGGAGLVLGSFMGGLTLGIAMMAGGAGFALLLMLGRMRGSARAEVKQALMSELAPPLTGLISVPPDRRAGFYSPDRVEAWGLFGPIHTVTVDECLAGTRDGFDVVVARIGLQFGNRANKDSENGAGLCFVAAEVAREGAEFGNGLLLPTDRPKGLNLSQIGLRPAPNQGASAELQSRYRAYGDVARLDAEAGGAIPLLEAQARSDRTATRVVNAGEGLRPSLIIRPDRVIVLTPLPLYDGAFDPPPFWEPLENDALLSAFAADTLSLDDYLTAAVAFTRGLLR